jgi:hypothetical protein
MTRFHQGQATTHARPHTTVDHRPDGAPLSFVAGPDEWVAVASLHVPSERVDAAVGAIETLIEEFKQKHPVNGAAVLQRHDDRRVVAFVQIDGHETYAHLLSAWDQHHLHLERREFVEQRDIALWNVVRTTDDFVLDPAAQETFLLGPNVTGVPSVTLVSDDQTKTITIAPDTQRDAERLRVVKTFG